jgi:hypothetical protein
MYVKHLLLFSAVAVTLGFSSCKQEEEVLSKEEASVEVLTQIKNLGFNNQNVQVVEGGYIVEGDIFLSTSNLTGAFNAKALRVGEVEQYRTTNIVAVSGSRVIKVSMASSLPASYLPALDEAIARYNAENLTITMQRVSSGADISLVAAPKSAQYLASAGFPTAAGNPHNEIKIAERHIGKTPDTNWFATILAHELGHCIGFRHTDYMDRSYSCGGSYYNEGASTVGAVHVPGTPTAQDPSSWMLACIGSGQNRPFNSNDKIALNYLY